MKKLQQKLSKVYLRQQAKGGIIDLEEEGKKMLVVTGGEESSSEFTELSPTDYQLGRKKLSFSLNQYLFKILWAYPVLPALLVCQLLLRSSRNKAPVIGMAVGKVAKMFLSLFRFVRRSRRRWEERGKSRRQRKRNHQRRIQ